MKRKTLLLLLNTCLLFALFTIYFLQKNQTVSHLKQPSIHKPTISKKVPKEGQQITTHSLLIDPYSLKTHVALMDYITNLHGKRRIARVQISISSNRFVGQLDME